MDPELNLSIVDLGLIYEIHQPAKDNVHIVMTLTTLGCPLFHVIESDIHKNLGTLGYDKEQIDIELVFDPPWSMDRMTENAKAMLGI